MIKVNINENDVIEDNIDIDAWTTDYFCLNNDINGLCNGACFKRVYLNKDDIKFKISWDPNTRENEEKYYFICPRCGLTTVLDSRILPLEIKEYAKDINVLIRK